MSDHPHPDHPDAQRKRIEALQPLPSPTHVAAYAALQGSYPQAPWQLGTP